MIIYNKDLYLSVSNTLLRSYPELTDLYLIEKFFYRDSNNYIKRNQTGKQAVQLLTLTNNLVKKDYIATATNSLKTILTFNTGYLNFMRNVRITNTLPAVSIAKRKAFDVFIKYSNNIYRSRTSYLIRNVSFRLSPNYEQYFILRPLNKFIFLMLFINLKRFSFQVPLYTWYNRFRPKKVSFKYLGFYVYVNITRKFAFLFYQFLKPRLFKVNFKYYPYPYNLTKQKKIKRRLRRKLSRIIKKLILSYSKLRKSTKIHMKIKRLKRRKRRVVNRFLRLSKSVKKFRNYRVNTVYRHY